MRCGGNIPEGVRAGPPGEGFALYRHRSAGKLGYWHGYYWARRRGSGDYEIWSIPDHPGGRPVPCGIFPREGFERRYERCDPAPGARCC